MFLRFFVIRSINPSGRAGVDGRVRPPGRRPVAQRLLRGAFHPMPWPGLSVSQAQDFPAQVSDQNPTENNDVLPERGHGASN
jgi:hypothetical protein